MGAEAEFAYLEDYILFGYLVANQLCLPEDAIPLSRAQRALPATMELRRMLGQSCDPRKLEQMGDALQHNITPRNRESFRRILPELREVLQSAREMMEAEESQSESPNGRGPAAPVAAEAVFPLVEELRDKRVEIGNRDRQLEAWAEAAVLFLGRVEALESDPELEASWRRVAASLRRQFGKSFAGVGFQLLIPEKGDPFDSSQHAAESIESSDDDLPPSTVLRTVQWGYRFPSGRVLKAHVVITPSKGN